MLPQARMWMALGCAPSLLVACPEHAADRTVPVPVPAVVYERAPPDPLQDTYVYVAKKPRVSLALVESRGLLGESLPPILNGLASQIDSCLQQRFAERRNDAGSLGPHLMQEEGAVRLVLAVSEQGMVSGVNIRTSSEAHSATVLICLVAKAKATRFTVTKRAERPGLALEALWRVSE